MLNLFVHKICLETSEGVSVCNFLVSILQFLNKLVLFYRNTLVICILCVNLKLFLNSGCITIKQMQKKRKYIKFQRQDVGEHTLLHFLNIYPIEGNLKKLDY